MKLNDWENKTSEWLEKVFDGDSKDIIDYLLSIWPVTIMEVGFGNNRLFKQLLATGFVGRGWQYRGFDKTISFVNRARKKFKTRDADFRFMNIEDEEIFLRVVEHQHPDILILRYILEHLPKWGEVLSWVNDKTDIPRLLISLYVSANKESRTDVEVGEECEYTVNYISDNDIDNLLDLYSLTSVKNYPNVTHTFRVYERKDV